MQTTRFVYRNPAQRIVFGRGTLASVAEELAAIAAVRPMLVCTARAARSAAGRALVASLGLKPDAVFDGVQSHAPVDSVHEGWKRACALKPDCFVALGGGSAMDTVKGIALAYAEQGRVLDFVIERTPDGRVIGQQSLKPKLPILAISTTLSGAEVSPSFALTNEAHKKLIIRDNAVAPAILVYDPELLRDVPILTLAASAMNALAHTVEGLYSKGRNPISALYAAEGLKLLHSGLSAAVENPADDEAYVSLSLGAYYAAAAIVNARTALHHAICHKLAPAAGLAHGIANAIVLPHALAFNLPAARAELAQAARLMCKDSLTEGSLRGEDAIAALEQLSARAGLPRRLRDVGVSQALFPALAQQIFSEPGLAFNPREIESVGEIEAVLHAAW